VRRNAKASSSGSNQGSGIRRALFGRSFATRGASSGVQGSGAPSYAQASALAPRVISRPLAIGGLLLALALAFALALAASPAHATYVQTAGWDLESGPGTVSANAIPGNGSFGIAADPLSGDVFTGYLSADPHNGGSPTPRRIDKWLSDGTPGTPASFGDTFSTASNYAGVAIDSFSHNVYALVDPVAASPTAPANPKIAIFEPDGTPVTSFEVSTNEAVGIDVDSSGNVYVPDPENGVVNKYSSTGTLLDTTGGVGGALNDPTDVALDGAGNLYVADKSTNRVNEQQTVDVQGNTGGSYRLSYEGAHTGVDFTGDLSYAQGTGDIDVGSGTADRTMLASGSGDFTFGSKVITNVSNAGDFTVGESIFDPAPQRAFPLGMVIESVNPGAQTITMSNPVNLANSFPDHPFVSGSKVLTNVTNIGDFKVGMGLVGSGFEPPEGIQMDFGQDNAFVTTITAIDTNANTITLSDGVTSAGSGSINGMVIENVQTTTGAFEARQRIQGGGLGADFFAPGISAVNGSSLVAADLFPPASDATGVDLEASGTIIHNVHVTSGQFSPELPLFGAGVPSDAEIDGPDDWDLQAGTVTMTCCHGNPFGIPLTQGGTGVSFHADLISASSTHEFEHALDTLPTLGAAKLYNGGFARFSESGPVQDGSAPAVKFQGAMGGRNLSQITCASVPADPLSGGSGDCSVTTDTDGSNTPGRVAKFDSGLEFVSNFVPPTTNYTADAVAVDKSSGDVYVAGGNSDWANPQGVLSGPDAPDFSVKRYDSAGVEQEQVGLGTLSASTYLSANGAVPLAPAFGLDYDSTAHKLYTVGRGTDLTYLGASSVVKAFSVGHILTVDPGGTGAGTVDADSGAISACAKGAGTCTGGYEVGATVTLSATPGPLSAFDGWTVDGQPGACTDPNSDCTVTINADTTVHATFTQTEENLTVGKNGLGTGSVTSNPAGIDCGSTCGPVAFDLHGDVTLTAGPDPGSTFTGWSVIGQPGACPGTGTCTVTLDTATTVVATFKTPQDLTVLKDGTGTGSVTSGPAGIDCGSTCGPAPFDEDSSVVLTAIPDAHQVFDGWSVEGQPGACPGTGTCSVGMTGAKTVTATFTQITHNVSVTRDGTGSGTVTSNPAGISCGSTCGPVAFPEGSDVVLTATQANHSTFDHWTGCDSSAANQCTVNVDGDENVAATFTLNKHTLTVTPVGNGSGSVDADTGIIAGCSSGGGVCTEPGIVEGTDVTLTATPGAHSTVAWSGCDSVITNQCTVTVDADTNLTATFTLDKHILTVAKSGSGSGSVTCDGGACASSYDYGSTVTLAASAASGSTFTGWSGACSGSGTCTVTIDGDKAVSAGFDANSVITPTCATDPTLCPKTEEKPLHCRKGFKKKKVHGKVKCVKIKKHKHHKH
jgi:Divergent InlB B-repeat domain